MKHLVEVLIIVIAAVTMVCCSKSDHKFAEQEKTIEMQEEETRQAKTEQILQDEGNTIEKAFHEAWKQKKICSSVEVSDGVVKVFFCNALKTAYFIDSPERRARFDLDILLNENGQKTGTIEYYTVDRKKIISISGSPSNMDIRRYH